MIARDKKVRGNAVAINDGDEVGDPGVVESPGGCGEVGVVVVPGGGGPVGEGAEAGEVAVAATTLMATF